MTSKTKRAAALILLTLALPGLLSGCWDSKELNHLLVVTGIALDTSDQPDKIDITVQVGDFSSGDSGGGGGGGGSDASSSPAIILKTTSNTVLSGFSRLDQDSNHRLLMQHNQIRLFGIELAQQGLSEHMDIFMRDPKARLEIPILVVDGRGEDALTAKLSQESISGIFLGGMMTQVSKMSMYYKVRLIDFVRALLEKTTAPVIPIVKVVTPDEEKEKEEKEKKQEIHLDGLAVFRGSQMIGRLDNKDTLGYLWSLGNVNKGNVEVSEGNNRAIMYITSLDCTQSVSLRNDGGIKVDLSVRSVLNLGEVYGFADQEPQELMKQLRKMSEETIKETILHSLRSAQELKSDIFGFGAAVQRKYPKQWKEMEPRWEELFLDLELDVQSKVILPLPGQVVQSLDMAKGAEENG